MKQRGANATARRSTSSRGKGKQRLDYVGNGLLLLLLLLTVYLYPRDWTPASVVESRHVFYYGWITAVSTGLGAVPFVFVSQPQKVWLGISNAIAGGMMLAASYSLAYEGSTSGIGADLDPVARTAAGFAIGLIFIVASKQIIKMFGDEVEFGDIKGADAQKMLLIIFVMTLHSVSEGIGIGVSFGGEKGKTLGQFISLSLAVHNVPEGLAVALVSTTKKVSKLRAGLWAVFTSLPQPLMAIPAFVFVKTFLPMLPAGLGFASGAMSYVALFELFPEAAEDSSFATTAAAGTAAFALMMFTQEAIKAGI